MFERCQWVMEQVHGYKKPWAIAGGWAIDLHIGRETRVHSDLEIAIDREYQHELREILENWTFRKVVNGHLENWSGERIELPVHELHGEKGQERIEVLLNELKDGEWIFRRDHGVTFPASKLILQTSHGIPYLHPAVVVLYKAKHMREKDHQDFLAVQNYLQDSDRHWLLGALRIHQPDHLWIDLLGGRAG